MTDIVLLTLRNAHDCKGDRGGGFESKITSTSRESNSSTYGVLTAPHPYIKKYRSGLLERIDTACISYKCRCGNGFEPHPQNQNLVPFRFLSKFSKLNSVNFMWEFSLHTYQYSFPGIALTS